MTQCPMPENWLPVVGYEGKYEVSDIGRVRSLDRWVQGPYVLQHRRGRILATGNKTGYPQVALTGGVRARVHELVLTAFVGPRPGPEYVTRHLDDDPTNNHLTNLRWGTESENRYDCVRNGHDRETCKTTCPRGHMLAEPNLVASVNGRTCLACARARTWVQNHPEAIFEEQADLYFKAIISGERVEGRICPSELNAAKTHCIRGHALAGANLEGNGDARACRSCRAACKTNRRARAAGKPEADLQKLADHYYITRYGGEVRVT